MKATGIVRRIDDLGRVVIPKEIRRTLRIREGDPLEIFTDREGEVILKKYSPIGELGSMAKQYAESLAQTMNCTVAISDADTVVAAAGTGKKDLHDKYISKELEQVIQNREQLVAQVDSTSYVGIIPDEKDFDEQVICPILSEGDAIGAVILLNRDDKRRFGPLEQKVALSAASFLGKQMEQ